MSTELNIPIPHYNNLMTENIVFETGPVGRSLFILHNNNIPIDVNARTYIQFIIFICTGINSLHIAVHNTFCNTHNIKAIWMVIILLYYTRIVIITNANEKKTYV